MPNILAPTVAKHISKILLNIKALLPNTTPAKISGREKIVCSIFVKDNISKYQLNH